MQHSSITTQNQKGEAFHARQRYLQQIGLAWDPFIIPVAEQEQALSGLSPQSELGQTPSQEIFSLAYFVPPQNPTNPEQSFFSALRQPVTAFIYGNPGSGKTSLRLALEATCRRVPDRTLVVSYLLGQDVAGILTTDEHRQRLMRQLAVDAFIQIMEQFKPGIDAPDENQQNALAQLMQMGGRPLQRLADRLINEPEPESLLGLAERWRSVGRLPVRHVARAPELRSLLQNAMTQATIIPAEHSESAFMSLWSAIKLWNFERIFILVDGVDTWWREPEKMLALIAPLLGETAVWQAKQIYCKYFLPLNLRQPVETFITDNSIQFTPDPFTATLTWDQAALRRLLAARFRAAGSRRTSLDDLVAIELAEQLDDLLLEEAHGSPRRLLQLVSALIDIHVQTRLKGGDVTTKERLITQEEWWQAVDMVARQFD